MFNKNEPNEDKKFIDDIEKAMALSMETKAFEEFQRSKYKQNTGFSNSKSEGNLNRFTNKLILICFST